MSSLASADTGFGLGGPGRSFRVPLTTVDAELLRSRWCADASLAGRELVLMKIDVEGFEAHALRGATRTLKGRLRCRASSTAVAADPQRHLMARPAFIHMEVRRPAEG